MKNILVLIFLLLANTATAAPPADYAAAFSSVDQMIPSGVWTKVTWDPSTFVNETDAVMDSNNTDFLFEYDPANGKNAAGLWVFHSSIAWGTDPGNAWPTHRRLIRFVQEVDLPPPYGTVPISLATNDFIYNPNAAEILDFPQFQQIYLQPLFKAVQGEVYRAWVEVYQNSGYTIPLKRIGIEAPFISLLKAQEP